MANITQKPKDPTELALSAIQDALKIGSGEVAPAAPDKTAAPVEAEAPGLFPAEQSDVLRQPANDDREQVGEILQALQRRSSRTPYVIAGAAGIVWAVIGLTLTWAFSADIAALFVTPRVGYGVVAAIAATILLPIIGFYAIAHLLSRAQDLRAVAESMAQVALRLAQPETAARDAVVSVGQAIRREVTAMGDGVERALARAAELEVLVHNEVSAIERAYNDNEVRVRDLISQLATQRETLVNQGEQVRNAIAAVHLDLSNDITSVGDLVAEKVNEVAQRVSRSLTEKGEVITLALGQAGDSMVQALSDRGSSLLDRLENSSYETTNAISNSTDRLTQSLHFRADTIHDEFADLTARLEATLTGRLEHIQKNFAQTTAITMETMAARSQQFTQNFNETGTRVADAVAVRTDDLTTRLRNAGTAIVQDIEVRGGEVATQIEQTGTRMSDALVSRSSAVSERFRESTDALVKALDTRNETVKEMLSARLKAFEDVFDQNGTELSEKVAREAAMLGSVITRNLAEFDNTVKTYGNELVERLGGRTKDVSDTMRSYLDSFDQRVTGRADDLAENLDKRLVRFEDILAARVANMAKTLGDGGREIVGTLDRRVAEITGTMESRGDAFVQSLTAKIGEVDRVLGTRADALADTLDVRYGRLEELLVGRTDKVTDQIELRTRAAADLLNARMEQLSQSIEMNASTAERSLGQLAQSTADTIRASVGDAERALVGTGETVAQSFIGQADRISNEVGQRTHDLEAILSEKSGKLLTALGDKGIEFGIEIERATGQALQSIEQKGATFARAVADNSTEMARLINTAGENAAGTVNRTVADLQQTADQVIARSKDMAQSAVSEMLETHNMLRSDATALFGRLREANIMLQEVLSGSHENMSALENTLMLRVSEFVTAMNEVTSTTGDVTSRMESNIGGFREVTGDVLANLGELARQFDVHGAQLANAAALIERSNRESEQSIGARRAQLETLVTTLDQRTGEISDRLKRFSGLVEESLEAAAARARDIARIVSESSADGIRAIDSNVERVRSEAENVGETLSASFQRVREEAEDVARAVQETGSASARTLTEQYAHLREQVESERRRASSSMHEIFEQNAGEAQALFEKANERFAETLRGMKQMASEMQRELEETRAELRRGVFELPQETAESAAQMRRVIVDQIEALAELNRIVARHGRNLDAVEPVRRSDAAPLAPRQEPRGESVREARAETPRTSLRNNDLSTFAPASRRSAEPATPSPASGNQAGRGWLSDILNRASREDEAPARDFARERTRETPRAEPEAPRNEERSARHTIESLDSLSVDIARMIDHDAAIDLWDRYKRGERNVFTRRLYTMQGQQAFDEIRKKYRGDRDFKQTVDRYVGEFERLLEEVSRDDRSQMVARTYLTSETGKVYTMLAHAAGRFE